MQRPCSDPCLGIIVTHMRRGDPIVSYRQCVHGADLKRRHATMTPQQIRSSLAEAVKFRSPNVPDQATARRKL